MEIINLDKLISDSISIEVVGPDGRIIEVYDEEKGVLSDEGMEYVIHAAEQAITYLAAMDLKGENYENDN